MNGITIARFRSLIVIFSMLQTALWGCSGLRTEIYREETLHRYQGACDYYKQGDYEAARSGMEEVIALDPDYGPAHAALGHLALIEEDYPEALAHYQTAVATDPELEAELRPLIMVAGAYKKRASLKNAGIGLNRIFPLIMADRRVEVEDLLTKDIPLQLLANDTMGITPGRLGEMLAKVAKKADPMVGSVRYRLFLGYLLFSGQTDDALASIMIESAVNESAGRDRQEALVALGQLHERQGEANAAVDAYLAAVDAGLPMTDVAHHLARVYRVDIESIMPSNAGPAEDVVPQEPMRIEISTEIPPVPAPDSGSLTEVKDIQISPRPVAHNMF